MPGIVDAFIRAVEDARQRLSRAEGTHVSTREVLRRAGYDDNQRAGVAYHLNPNRHPGDRPHRVPVEVVRRLAAVLPVSEDELAQAAQVAAGFTLAQPADHPDVAVIVARYLGDDAVSEADKRAVTARLLQLIADETSRNRTDT